MGGKVANRAPACAPVRYNGGMSYAMRLQRVVVPKPWAGSALGRLFPAAAAEWPPGTGESIEVGDLDAARTHVANGQYRGQTLTQLMETRRQALMGQLAGADDLPDFPLCLKLIDAREPLSVQVHPGDEFHKGRRVRRGKSEGWLVLRAEENAVIYQGLRPGLSRADFEDALRNNQTPHALNARAVKAGDWLCNPAGMVHAIGGGLALLEVQQNCDTTLRLWDFPRKVGPWRRLHTAQGLATARFDLPLPKIQRAGEDTVLHDDGPLGVRHLRLSQPLSLTRNWAGFTLVTCLEGGAEVSARAGNQLEAAVLAPPDTVLFSAEFWDFEFYPRPNCRIFLSWARAG